MPALHNKAHGQHTGRYLMSIEGSDDPVEAVEAETWQEAVDKFVAARGYTFAKFPFTTKVRPTRKELAAHQLAVEEYNELRKSRKTKKHGGLVPHPDSGEMVPVETLAPAPLQAKHATSWRVPSSVAEIESTNALRQEWDGQTYCLTLDLMDGDHELEDVCIRLLAERE